MRTLPPLNVPSLAAASRLVSGSYVQAFGLPAFVLEKIGAKFVARLYLIVVWNQRASRLIGPPIDGFTSRYRLSVFGVVSPRFLSSSLKFSPCIDLFAYPA